MDPATWAQRLHYHELLDFTPDGYLVTDPHGIIFEANRAAAALLRCPREFLAGKPLALFVTQGQRQQFYQRLARSGRGGAVEHWETRVGRPKDEPRDVAVTAAAVYGEEGRLTGFRWLLRDVSPARRVERALQSAERLFESLVDAAEAVILVVDHAGRVVRSNPYLHLVSGYHAPDLQGRDWCDLIAPPDRAAARRMLEEALRSGLGKSGVLGLAPRSGRPRAMTWSARGLPDEPNGVAVLLGYDVTELQEVQRQALQVERLAAIGQVAAGLAHESRNALQRIQACLSLLALRVRGQPESLDLLERAQKAQDDLHRLFEDVRSFAGTPRLEPARCNLGQVWREAWTDLDLLHDRKVARLSEDLDGTDTLCEVDAFQLKRVFRNLFENALATGVDPVRVDVQCRPATLGGRDALQVRVRDNGPGFPDGQRHRLFEPFFTTKTRGTGLGLALCRRIVEAHGGQIEAGPGDGPGAEVILTLPRRTP